jgi:hypothetical protein
MVSLSDEFSIINKLEYENNITDLLLNSDNYEIIINYYYNNSNFDDKFLKNYLKEFKKGLLIAKKKNTFDIKYYLNFIKNYLNKIEIMENLNQVNAKSIMVNNLLDLILKEKWLNLIIFKNMLLNISKDYLDIINKINNIEYNKWFYQEYADYTIENLDYKDKLIPENLKIYNSFNNLSDLYLKNNKFNINYTQRIAQKIIQLFNSILDTNCINFLLSNSYITKIFNILKNTENIVKIIKKLFNENNDLENNLPQVINFINDISNKLDSIDKNVINNILNKTLIENQKNLNTLVELYYNKQLNIILEIICRNDLLKNNFIHLFKTYLTNNIINNNKTVLDFNYNKNKNNLKLDLVKYKFYKLHHDLEIIDKDLENTRALLTIHNDNNININAYLLTPNCYPIDFSQGNINEKYNNNTYLSKIINNINDISLKGSNNKLKSIFHPHLGNIKFEYKYNNQNHIVKMLPIQFMVLEDISTNNFDIKYYSYPKEFMDKVISSLLNGKIISTNKDNYIVNDTTNILDYIEIFYNTNINKISNEDRLYDQNTILMTWINKLVKTNPSTKQQIINYLEENLSIKHFQISNDMVDTTIKYMIDNDYIEMKEDKYLKLLY